METIKGIKVLVTGASGFIGSFLCEEGLKRGCSVWAGMRKRSSRRYLQNEWLQFVELDMTDKSVLKAQLTDFKNKYGAWDVVIHVAGATKCLKREDFDLNNYVCTRNLADSLVELEMTPKQFIFVSSLSVLGPVRESECAPHEVRTFFDDAVSSHDFKDTYTVSRSVYEPITASDIPVPNTAYGLSKLRAEDYLRSLDGFPLVIFRPTGVYGPREKDYFLMVKSIKGRVDFSVGFKPQEITFVYVRDLVGAIWCAVEKGVCGRTYLVSDGYVYNSRAFSDLIQKNLRISGVLHVKAPLWLLRAVSAVSEAVSGITGKAGTLNGDKYNILKQRNWQCDISPMVDELGYTPQWNLERGVEETINWYKKEKWI